MGIYREFSKAPFISDEPENAQYVPYVFLEGFFSNDEIKRINDLWNNETAMDSKVYTADYGVISAPEQRRSRKCFLKAEGNEWLYDKIGALCLMINASKFRFSLSGFQGPLAYNLYESGHFFTWHMDYGADANSNRKLVVSIQLSDANEYSGGELQLVTPDIVASKTKGSIAIFPSYILHRVTPITAGCRKSLIAHVGGPPFK